MPQATWGIVLSAFMASAAWAGEEELPRFASEAAAPRTNAARALDGLMPEVPEPLQEVDQKDKERSDGVHRADGAEFTIGPMGGYLKARDADNGTWFGGVQARFRFLRILAVEGSISFHQNDFNDGDITVTQYPVQLTALILPFANSPIDPYVLAGVGWYYTRVDFDDNIGGGHDTDNIFGFHAGAGLNIWLKPGFSIFGDFRWVFLDRPGVDDSNLSDQEYDYWQITFGLNFRL